MYIHSYDFLVNKTKRNAIYICQSFLSSDKQSKETLYTFDKIFYDTIV